MDSIRQVKDPRFSVVIPTCNRRHLLGQAIDSVLAQTFPDYEIIVVDDGSADGTPGLLRHFGNRIRTLSQANRGDQTARARGAAIAVGEYLALLDDDDVLFPDALAIYDRIIQAREAPPLILGAMSYFHGESGPPPSRSAARQIAFRLFPDFLSKDVGFGISNSRIVVKRSVVHAAGAIEIEPIVLGSTDVHLLLKVGNCGPCILVQHPHTVGYRLHQTNTIKRLDYIVDSINLVADLERRDAYPGARALQFKRRAFIGGKSAIFVKETLKKRQFRLARRLASHTGPMILAAMCNRLRRRFHQTTPLQYLPFRTNELQVPGAPGPTQVPI